MNEKLITVLTDSLKISTNEANNFINNLEGRINSKGVSLEITLTNIKSKYKTLDSESREKYLISTFGQYGLAKGKTLINALDKVWGWKNTH